MARQKTIFQNFRSIAGAALIGFGSIILVGNLAIAVSRLTHLFGITAGVVDTFGVLTAGALAALNASQVYVFDHTEFLRSLHRILLSFCPLLLVIVGTLLLRASFAVEGDKNSKKGIPNVSISPSLVRCVDKAGIGG